MELEIELGWETEGDRDDAGTIRMADDEANDGLTDDNIDDEETEAGVDESKGVDSEAGGSPVLVLASRLQTGQKVLHDVSQASTQTAWNSVKSSKNQSFHEEKKYFARQNIDTTNIILHTNVHQEKLAADSLDMNSYNSMI